MVLNTKITKVTKVCEITQKRNLSRLRVQFAHAGMMQVNVASSEFQPLDETNKQFWSQFKIGPVLQKWLQIRGCFGIQKSGWFLVFLCSWAFWGVQGGPEKRRELDVESLARNAVYHITPSHKTGKSASLLSQSLRGHVCLGCYRSDLVKSWIGLGNFTSTPSAFSPPRFAYQSISKSYCCFVSTNAGLDEVW